MKNNKKPLVTVLSFTFAAAAYLIADSAMAGGLPKPMPAQATDSVEQNLVFSRKGYRDGYQALMTSCSTSLDEQWFIWLDKIAADVAN